MRKKRFIVKYSKVSTGNKYSVGAFSLRVQAEKLLLILASNPDFIEAEIEEIFIESM